MSSRYCSRVFLCILLLYDFWQLLEQSEMRLSRMMDLIQLILGVDIWIVSMPAAHILTSTASLLPKGLSFHSSRAHRRVTIILLDTVFYRINSIVQQPRMKKNTTEQLNETFPKDNADSALLRKRIEQSTFIPPPKIPEKKQTNLRENLSNDISSYSDDFSRLEDLNEVKCERKSMIIKQDYL